MPKNAGLKLTLFVNEYETCALQARLHLNLPFRNTREPSTPTSRPCGWRGGRSLANLLDQPNLPRHLCLVLGCNAQHLSQHRRARHPRGLEKRTRKPGGETSGTLEELPAEQEIAEAALRRVHCRELGLERASEGPHGQGGDDHRQQLVLDEPVKEALRDDYRKKAQQRQR